MEGIELLHKKLFLLFPLIILINPIYADDTQIQMDWIIEGQIDDNNITSKESEIVSILNWKPSIKWIIDEWYKVKTTGQPYNGNTKPKWFSMAEGAGDVVLNDRLPQHIKDKVLKAKADILSGKLVVPVIVGPVKSD